MAAEPVAGEPWKRVLCDRAERGEDGRSRDWRVSLTNRVAAKLITTEPLAAKPAAFKRKDLPGQSQTS